MLACINLQAILFYQKNSNNPDIINVNLGSHLKYVDYLILRQDEARYLMFVFFKSPSFLCIVQNHRT